MSNIPDFLQKEFEASEKRKAFIRNTPAYQFFEKNKIPITIICTIAAICAVFISANIYKHNHINSLYKKAIEYQEKGDYSTALHYLDKILDEDADNSKAKELYHTVEESFHRQEIENSLNNAVDYKNSENYISAYNYAQSAYSSAQTYGYSKEKSTAEQLMNELRPLKEQQEAEAAAEAEQKANAKAEAEAAAKSEAEARAKAEQEAKEKAEQEAKAKSEAEAKAKAEKEAKEKAAQAAKAKSEAEAKAKAEKEAKEKAAQAAKTAEQLEEEYVNSCISVTSEELQTKPSSYKGKKVAIEGCITSQVTLRKGKIDSFLEGIGVYESDDTEEIMIDEEIAVLYSPSELKGRRFLNDYFVFVYGEFMGLTEITSTNAYGTEFTRKIPQIRAKYIYD